MRYVSLGTDFVSELELDDEGLVVVYPQMAEASVKGLGPGVKSYHLTTFGCQMNEHDSERMKGMLESLGYARGARAATAPT